MNETFTYSKTSMTKRRPLVMPDWYNTEVDLLSSSYFSEYMAILQPAKETILKEMYRPNFGIYKYSNSKVICKQAVDFTSKGVISCKFSPDGRYLVLGLGNGLIQVYSLADKIICTVVPERSSRKVTAIRYDNIVKSDQFFASSLSGIVFLVGKMDDDLTWEGQILFNENENEINAMDCGKMSTLTTAGKDATIRHYDVPSKKLIRIFDKADLLCNSFYEEALIQGHSKRICSLKYSGPDSDVFVSGGWDNSIKIWDIRCPNGPVNSIYGFHITGDSLDVLNNIILCGQWTSKNNLQLLDLRTCKVLQVINPKGQGELDSGDFINSVQYLRAFNGGSENLIIKGGSGTCAVEIISIKESMVLHSIIESNAIFALDSFEKLIAYGGYCDCFTILEFAAGMTVDSYAIKGSDNYADSIKSESVCTKKVDPQWNKSLDELRDAWRNIPKVHLPTDEEKFMKDFLDEVAGFAGCGPYSLIGEKLSHYLQTVQVLPNTSEQMKNQWQNNREKSGKITYGIGQDFAFKEDGVKTSKKKIIFKENESKTSKCVISVKDDVETQKKEIVLEEDKSKIFKNEISSKEEKVKNSNNKE